jgi:uncharacterized lipoprotein NlpE involved in copper resistance
MNEATQKEIKEAIETLTMLLKPGVYCKVTFNILDGKMGDTNFNLNAKPKEIVELTVKSKS